MNRPTDVAVFVASLRIGGAERPAVAMAGGLADAGLAVDLVVARGGGPLAAEVSPTVRVVDLGARRTSVALPGLVAYLRREQPRVLVPVVTHACLVALAAARLGRRGWRPPVVVVEVSPLLHATAQSGLARDRLLPMLARRLYPAAAAVVGNSRQVADDLVAACPRLAGRIEILPPAIVGPRLWKGAAEAVDEDWFAAGRPPVLVTVARLVPEKDLGTLLTAFARVRATGRDVRLLVVGEGPERARLEALAAGLGLVEGVDVRLPGADPNPYRYMARAVAVVLSSRVEGMPTVLVEALALGVPVVATDCPSGPRELLADGRFGRLVPVGDAPALAAAIEDVLDRPPPPPPEEAWDRYRVDRAAAALHDLLRQVWRDAATSRHRAS